MSTLNFHDLKYFALERHFNKMTAVGIKGDTVCIKSSFGQKLGTSPSPMVGGWPHCHGYSTLISMKTLSCWEDPLLAGADTLFRTAPTHTNIEKACKHKNIMNPVQNINTSTNKHTCKYVHIQSYGIWMLIWIYISTRAGQKSAVFHARQDAFSNSSTHKCIIRLF